MSKVKVTARYMLVPYDKHAQRKQLLFRNENGICVELAARLSEKPDYLMPYDMGRFVGQTLDMETIPEVDFIYMFVNHWNESDIYHEKYRPIAHFTPKHGWNNDPNGFVFYEGQYHLFFQHNPVEPAWENMHWGHAVSKDLVHWEELDEALFPDDYGLMFSGSAVIDTENRTGLKCSEHAPMLLFYTAAGGRTMSAGRQFTQHLAYSTDGGKTFIKFGKPLIDTVTPSNRDPKVIYCDEIAAYLMVLYLKGHEFALYTSQNLLKWDLLQRICIEEDDECPDIYPLMLEGERYWVMTAAHDRYLIGKFLGGHFIPLYPVGRLHYGAKSYAAQTCFGVEDSRRIRFGWNQSTIPDMRFNGSMTTPHTMTLRRINGRAMLCAWPCAEFETLRGKKAEGKDELQLNGPANDILLSVPMNRDSVIELFGCRFEICAKDSECVCPASNVEMPLTAENGRFRLRVIQDVHSIEIYAGQGEATLCVEHISDYCFKTIRCKGADIEAYPLSNIHQ